MLESRSFADRRLHEFLRASLPGRSDEWNLARLTLAGLYFHPDIDIARSRLGAARAAIATARQIPNPTLNVSPLYNLDVATPTPWTVGGVVSFVIETFGKRGARTARARALAEAARWDSATAGWQVRARVRAALIALWAAERRLDIARRRLTLQSQLVALLAQRFVAGGASALDLERERVNRAQMVLAIGDLERARADLRVQLATAIGVPVRALDAIHLALAEFDTNAPPAMASAAALRERALTGRTDIEASLAEYKAAEAALRLEVANQYPNLSIGPEYDWGAITETSASNQVGTPLGFELPIFNRNEGPIAEAAARRRQAAAAFTALQARIIGQVDSAASDYRAALRTLATAETLRSDAEGRLRRVETSFRAGALDRPTLVTAEIEAAAATRALLDARLAERRAVGALEDALQQPFFDPGAWPTVSDRNPRPLAAPAPAAIAHE